MSPSQRDKLIQAEFNLETVQEELADVADPAATDLATALRALDRAMRR